MVFPKIERKIGLKYYTEWSVRSHFERLIIRPHGTFFQIILHIIITITSLPRCYAHFACPHVWCFSGQFSYQTDMLHGLVTSDQSSGEEESGSIGCVHSSQLPVHIIEQQKEKIYQKVHKEIRKVWCTEKTGKHS